MNFKADNNLLFSLSFYKSFLRGLDIFGRGDWRSISRDCVITRTTTEVASHAQKLFNHINACSKQNRTARLSVLNIISPEAETVGT
ncbi:hypothetical protein T459_35585 [Capsicum annuum]|uniref:HTH myb-type domain-containing protein n=1 Tax=Capsicum annuum TaxID=4072 RepID=A0A2G2WVN0_CAPAN|nr:hypothetical protein T459_35585 [Capsicum annuum]